MSPAKILLFGEYTVLVGSNAFAIPFPGFTCQLVKSSKPSDSNKLVCDFIQFLLSKPSIFNFLDLKKLKKDWETGLDIISDIPVQYGLGSSGAVTAEIYRNYSYEFLKPLSEIKKELALMEQFMHGTSSGIDPLVCFLQKPIHISQQEVSLVPFSLDKLDFKIFLIDTNIKAATRDYVTQFLSNFRNNDQFNSLVQRLIEINNQCINELFYAPKHFIKSIKELSLLEFEIFPFLFPSHMVSTLKVGREENIFYPKLCGSGGGGYVLGFTIKPQQVMEFFSSRDIEIKWI
ncbi:MAG: hypothetical protein N2662_01410 [Bacteroidales bacterium]|nr:hypothetical protein [Bacteroidales bacterium]